ncbi:hypothetical protein [Burkholderia contaminans]|uniref:Uncharacterized protein n=1 Tax=Burkholderia contaminans TaxID=488447 RepID=A0A6P3BF27_9BURK|nr:hypothetical protein [Burkholderia contaminans]VWD55378.1 hypothetical protein BCO71033_05813 [Burkholderia contaminans]
MRKYLLLVVLVMYAFDASAQFPFSQPPFFGQPKPRFGLGMIFSFPAPSPDESREDASEFCVQAAVSALMRFDDFLVASTSSILPGSPIAPQQLPKVFPAFPGVKHSPTTYYLNRNRCVRGYEALKEVAVDMPTFEHLYAGLMQCEQIYGRERIANHALCVAAIAGAK